MNYPAANRGVSIAIFIIAPGGGELNLHPPLEDSSASGRLITLITVEDNI